AAAIDDPLGVGDRITERHPQPVDDMAHVRAAAAGAGAAFACLDRLVHPSSVPHRMGRGAGIRLPGRGSRTRTATRRPRGVLVPWFVLVVSGMLEAVWAVALDRSQGFTRAAPTAVFLVAVTVSMVG